MITSATVRESQSVTRMRDRGFPISTYAPRGGGGGGGGGGGSSLLYIAIAYYMQKGDGWVQIVCKIAYVLNGRPHRSLFLVCSAFVSQTPASTRESYGNGSGVCSQVCTYHTTRRGPFTTRYTACQECTCTRNNKKLHIPSA